MDVRKTREGWVISDEALRELAESSTVKELKKDEPFEQGLRPYCCGCSTPEPSEK
jgi:hypothetical protein